MRERGFSLIELLVALAIAGIILAMGIPPLLTVIATTQSRSVAESIQTGLKLARAEAISRNAPMRFQLVTDLTATCGYSTTSIFWVVTQTDQATRGQAAGYCNASPFFPPDQPDPCNPAPATCACNPDVTPSCNRATLAANCRPLGNPVCANEPYIVLKSPTKTYPAIAVAANAAIVTFGPLGQVLTNLEGAVAQPSLAQVNVTPADTDAKTWRLRISAPSGAIKLCDPNAPISDPLSCA